MYKSKELEIINRLAHTIKYHVYQINYNRQRHYHVKREDVKKRILEEIKESEEQILIQIQKLSQYL